MKLRSILAIGIIACSMLFACGCSSDNTPTSKELNDAEVYGDGADFITIVSDTYTLEKKEGQLRLKVKLELDSPTSQKISAYPEVILKDEDGVEVIGGLYQMEMSSSTQNKFDKFLQGTPSDVQEFVFISRFNTDYFNDALAKSESFSLEGLSFRTSQNREGSNSDLDEINDVIDQTQDIIDVTEDIIETNQALLDMAKELSE